MRPPFAEVSADIQHEMQRIQKSPEELAEYVGLDELFLQSQSRSLNLGFVGCEAIAGPNDCQEQGPLHLLHPLASLRTDSCSIGVAVTC